MKPDVERLVQRISRWADQQNTHKFESLCGDENPVKVMAAIQKTGLLTMESIQEASQALWDNAMSWQATRDELRKAMKAEQFSLKGMNRCLYTTEVALRMRTKGAEGRPAWSFEFGLNSPGVMDRWLAHQPGWDSNEPTSCQVINDLPLDPETQRQYEPRREEWDIFSTRGWRVSKKKLMWHWELEFNDQFETLADVHEAMLPLAIDWTAYNHRLRAPLVPGGYLHGQQVAVVNITDDTTEVMGVDSNIITGYSEDQIPQFQSRIKVINNLLQHVNPAKAKVLTEERDMLQDMANKPKLENTDDNTDIELTIGTRHIPSAVDGSGVYDPDHPQMAELVEKYGPVIFQLTIINPEIGLFAKGLVRPVEGACEKYGNQQVGVFLDNLQVKGALKGIHKQAKNEAGDLHVVYDNVAIGIMDARRGEKEYYPGFEQTENVDMNVIAGICKIDKKLAKALQPGQPLVVKTGSKERDGKVLLVLKRGGNRFLMVEAPDLRFRQKIEVYVLDADDKVCKLVGNTLSKAMTLAKSLMTDSLEDLGRGGLEAALRRVERTDDQIRSMAELERRALEVVKDDVEVPNVLGLPMVQNAIENQTQGQLWRVVTGCGQPGRQRTIIMDNALEPGTVVAAGFKPGRELAIWRFPCIMACGLLVLKSMEPLRSHLVRGEVVDNCIFMHPDDVKRIQGDDDGDIVGVSADRRLVELFRCRNTNNFYAIEPKGEPLLGRDGNPMAARSEEGRLYAQTDPMGAVGLFTIMRSKLLAVDDRWGALAMSCLIQEAIDSGKRKTRWTNYKAAALQQNWKLFGDEWCLHYDGSNNYHPETDISEDKLIDEVVAWVTKRLNHRGCIITFESKQNPITWYYQYKREDKGFKRVRKKIVISEWGPCVAKSNGFAGGNLVHRINDWAYTWWENHSADFAIQAKKTSTERFLPQLLEAIGAKVNERLISTPQYQGLANRIGLDAFGKEMNKAMKQTDPNIKNQEIQRAINGLNAELATQASLQDLVDTWVYNMTPRWRYRVNNKSSWRFTTNEQELPQPTSGCGPHRVDKPQTAFRVATHPSSEVLLRLGIEPLVHCGFLDKEARTAPTRLQAITNYSLGQPEPFVTMTNLVFTDSSHSKEVFDEAGDPVELHECQYCRTQLQTALVRAIRRMKQVEQTRTMRELMTSVRQAQRFHTYPTRRLEGQANHEEDGWDMEAWGL